MSTRIVLLAGLLASVACKKAAPPAPPPPAVQVAEVVQRDVPIYREWVGSLDGFVNADIRPQVAGYVREQVYREGAYVDRGQRLFLIDPRNYKALADQAKSVLQRNLATLAKARLDVQRDRQLIASHGIAGFAQAQVGTLISTSSVMTTVSQVDPIKAQFNISETEYLRSAEGNHWAEPERGADAEPALEVILDDGSVYPRRGSVVVINRQVNPQTGTIAIQGAFPNPGNVLRPGQYAKVRAAIDTRKGALLVPQRALSELQGAYQIGVVGSDGKVDVRTVKAGEQVGELWIIEEGLRPGEKVIVEGFARVRPGMAVQATPAPSNPTASNAPPTAAPSSGR